MTFVCVTDSKKILLKTVFNPDRGYLFWICFGFSLFFAGLPNKTVNKVCSFSTGVWNTSLMQTHELRWSTVLRSNVCAGWLSRTASAGWWSTPRKTNYVLSLQKVLRVSDVDRQRGSKRRKRVPAEANSFSKNSTTWSRGRGFNRTEADGPHTANRSSRSDPPGKRSRRLWADDIADVDNDRRRTGQRYCDGDRVFFYF